jgi:hypothetical protein
VIGAALRFRGSKESEENMVSEDTKWLTPAQAARALGVTPLRVRQLMQQGKLDHVWTPLGRLVDPDSVAERARERLAVTA